MDLEFELAQTILNSCVKSKHVVQYGGAVFELFSSYRTGFHYRDVYRSDSQIAIDVWDGDMSCPWDGSHPPSCGVHELLSDMLKAVSLMYSDARAKAESNLQVKTTEL